MSEVDEVSVTALFRPSTYGVRMDASALDRFLKNYEDISDSVRELNEADTKHMIVNPFLMALGWNFIPSEIQAEYPVKVGRNYQYADYCLKMEGGPIALLEVKPFGTRLDKESLGQVLAYGRVKLIRWCMITDGSDFVLLDSQDPSDSWEDAEVFRFAFPEVKDSGHYIAAISKEGLGSGLLDELAEEIYARRSLLSRFSEKREEVKSRVLRAISGIGLSAEDAAQSAERFLTQIRGALEGGHPEIEVIQERPKILEVRERPRVSGTLPIIKRKEISAPDDSLVAIFPSQPQGEEFIRKFNAWGFVFIRGRPTFCAIYFSRPEHRIRIIASVSRIVPALDWVDSNRDRAPEQEWSTPDPRKYVLEFEDNRVWELEDPLPWQPDDPVIQSLRYTTIGDLKVASRVGDLRYPDVTW